MTTKQKIERKDKAQLIFMVATLNSLHSHHYEYPYEELKSLEKSCSIDILDGTIYSHDLFRKSIETEIIQRYGNNLVGDKIEIPEYSDCILECFILKRMIEIFSGKDDFFGTKTKNGQ